ncbi:MAG: hypothetical protein FWG29_09855, partial [Treponema sp.]|nr:hypothetical protein [Treponema sp.]
MINLKAVCRLPFASLLIRRNFSLLALFVVLSLILTACSNGSTDSSSGEGGTFIPEYSIDDTGPGGGKIIYVSTGGFTVTGTGSFTAHYLEAAPANMATNLKWCSHTGVPWCDVTTGTAIGTGKANTAAIIAAHSGDTVANNAAKACAEYSNNGKTDWFLPSKDEL